MKYGGYTIAKMLAIPFSLLHPLGKTDLLAALALDVNTIETG